MFTVSLQVAHVQYYIKPGTVDGDVCHVRGEGSCDPGEEPGDIQLKISVQKHAEYSLNGSDLVCTHRVALAELLQGNLVTLLINSNLLDADSSTIHFTQLKVIHYKHIDGNSYKLIAPASPAPKQGLFTWRFWAKHLIKSLSKRLEFSSPMFPAFSRHRNPKLMPLQLLGPV